jgi:hypothetical protein
VQFWFCRNRTLAYRARRGSCGSLAKRNFPRQRLVVDYPSEGRDLLSFSELTGKIVSLGEEGIADCQFFSIFGRIHQHGACRHQPKRPKVVGLGPPTEDCPVSRYQGQRQIDRWCSQEHSGKLLALINAEESLLVAASSNRIKIVSGGLAIGGVYSMWGQDNTSSTNCFRYFGSPCPLH